MSPAGRRIPAALAALLVALVVTGLTVAPPAAAASAALVVTPTPCSPRAGVCTATPSGVAVTFPAGIPAGVSDVQLAWVTTGRPAGAPGPASTSALLPTSSGGCATAAGQAATTCTWPWPASLEGPGAAVLNGTYQASACSGSSCSPPPSSFGVGVAPLAPGSVAAHAQGGAPGSPVTISWAPGSAPDLAGYQVARDGTAIYTCTLHGATSPGAGPCPPTPSTTDRSSGSGALTYQVVAYRYGPQGGFAGALASPPASGTVQLGAGGGRLGSVPVLGPPAPATVTAPAQPGRPVVGGASRPGSANTYGALPSGPAGRAAPSATQPLELGAGRSPQVGGLALIAAGLLVFAIAAHLIYLRGAIARYQAAHGAPVTTERSPRPRRRVQWGSWPPIRRLPDHRP